MSTVTEIRQYTPDDLLALPDGDSYELIDGQLVERNMGGLSSHIGVRLASLLTAFCDKTFLGWTFGADCSYQCFPSFPNLVRKPDVSFIRLGRLPNEEIPQGHVRIPPDLAVEILSPNDLCYETDRKVEQYLRAGVQLVWVVSPEVHTILIYRANGSIEGRRDSDELSGEEVLPGFHCSVKEIFQAPTKASPSA